MPWAAPERWWDGGVGRCGCSPRTGSTGRTSCWELTSQPLWSHCVVVELIFILIWEGHNEDACVCRPCVYTCRLLGVRCPAVQGHMRAGGATSFCPSEINDRRYGAITAFPRRWFCSSFEKLVFTREIVMLRCFIMMCTSFAFLF